MIPCPSVYDIYLNKIMDPADRYALEHYIALFLLGQRESIPHYVVLYGGPATGKSTILHILNELFGNGQVDYTIQMAKLSKAHAMIIHDTDVDKFIQNTINDQDLKNAIFFLATNSLPKEHYSNVKILYMTGKKIKKSIFETVIYHGLYAMKEEYKAYCIDQLHRHLYWNNKYLSMERELK